MKVGIYVGSFNPVHKGHIYVANTILERKLVDKVMIIPTNDYWDKKINTTLEHRINMLNFYKNDKIIVDKNYNNLQYTYEILNDIKKDNPNYELYLIIGDDLYDELYKWKNYNEIIKNKIIVVRRNKDKVLDSNFIVINDYNPLKVSSTYIREHINDKDILNYIDKEIYDYIKENNLYRE